MYLCTYFTNRFIDNTWRARDYVWFNSLKSSFRKKNDLQVSWQDLWFYGILLTVCMCNPLYVWVYWRLCNGKQILGMALFWSSQFMLWWHLNKNPSWLLVFWPINGTDARIKQHIADRAYLAQAAEASPRWYHHSQKSI